MHDTLRRKRRREANAQHPKPAQATNGAHTQKRRPLQIYITRATAEPNAKRTALLMLRDWRVDVRKPGWASRPLSRNRTTYKQEPHTSRILIRKQPLISQVSDQIHVASCQILTRQTGFPGGSLVQLVIDNRLRGGPGRLYEAHKGNRRKGYRPLSAAAKRQPTHKAARHSLRRWVISLVTVICIWTRIYNDDSRETGDDVHTLRRRSLLPC